MRRHRWSRASAYNQGWGQRASALLLVLVLPARTWAPQSKTEALANLTHAFDAGPVTAAVGGQQHGPCDQRVGIDQVEALQSQRAVRRERRVERVLDALRRHTGA